MESGDYDPPLAPGLLVAQSWQATVILGAVTLILGLIVSFHPGGSLNVVAVLLGILMICSGIFHLVRIFGRGEAHRIWLGISGLLLIVIGVAQFALLFVVSFSMISSAVCGLVGPIFVPFFIVPTLEWLFWGWLKAFIQYSFMLVIANAFIFVFEKFLSRYLQTLPPGLRLEDQLLYGVHAVMILVTFTDGVLLVPSLTASIFSGRSGESVLPSQIRSV